VTQVVEHLPSKSEALSSNPGTSRKKKKRGSLVNGGHRIEALSGQSRTISPHMNNKRKMKKKKGKGKKKKFWDNLAVN
jgi:hypothetical protein